MTFEQINKTLEKQQLAWLITGCAGFIGFHLASELLDKNQNVIGLDNFINGDKNKIKILQNNKKFQFIQADLRDFELCLKATKKIDFVLHQAALGSVTRSLENPLLSHDCNVNSFINLIEASKQNKVKCLIYASSSSVYGDDKSYPQKENKTGKALAIYPLTKQICELYAQNYHHCFGTQTIGLRYFNVFGAYQNPKSTYSAVIPKWITQLINGEQVEIYGDGKTSRDFTYIKNIVQANLLACFAEKSAVNQVYNVACQKTTSLNQLLEIIQNSMASLVKDYVRQKPVYKEQRQGDLPYSLADIEKAGRLLGYCPTHCLEDGIAQTVAWYLKQSKL